MRRYYIKYQGQPPFDLLPMEGKVVRGMFDAEVRDEGVPEDVVLTDEDNGWLNICLSFYEAGLAYEAGLSISLDIEHKPEPLGLQYYEKVTAGPTHEYYLGGDFRLDRNYNGWTNKGRAAQSFMGYMRWDKLHRAGLLGEGTVLCLIDGGYSTDQPGHEMLVVSENMIDTSTDNHAVAGATLVCGKNIGKGFVSIAPGAEVYMTNINMGVGACIAWGLSKKKPGQRMVFSIPYLTYPDEYFREQVQAANNADCLVFIATGNNKVTPGVVNPLCIQGTISVGGTKGGNAGPYLDELQYQNYIVNSEGKGIDIVCPADCFAGGTPDPDQPYVSVSTTYYKFSGTSSTCDMIAGLAMLYMQKYPNRSARACFEKIKLDGRQVAGYPFPQLSIL